MSQVFPRLLQFEKITGNHSLVGMYDIPKGVLVCMVTSAWERTGSRDSLQIKWMPMGEYSDIWFDLLPFLFFRCIVGKKNSPYPH